MPLHRTAGVLPTIGYAAARPIRSGSSTTRFIAAMCIMLAVVVLGAMLVNWLLDHEYHNVLTALQISGIAGAVAVGVVGLMSLGRRK